MEISNTEEKGTFMSNVAVEGDEGTDHEDLNWIYLPAGEDPENVEKVSVRSWGNFAVMKDGRQVEILANGATFKECDANV